MGINGRGGRVVLGTGEGDVKLVRVVRRRLIDVCQSDIVLPNNILFRACVGAHLIVILNMATMEVPVE